MQSWQQELHVNPPSPGSLDLTGSYRDSESDGSFFLKISLMLISREDTTLIHTVCYRVTEFMNKSGHINYISCHCVQNRWQKQLKESCALAHRFSRSQSLVTQRNARVNTPGRQESRMMYKQCHLGLQCNPGTPGLEWGVGRDRTIPRTWWPAIWS